LKNLRVYNGKNILVLGLAKSGFAAAKLLHKLGANVTVNDRKPIEQNPVAESLLTAGIRVICGAHPLSLLDGQVDLIVKNPGIPYKNPLITLALEKNIPIITEVELAFQISEAEFVGITGSNGKTTTTTLIYEMLKRGEKNPLIAGNIGTAVACDVAVDAKDENIIVTELSSFQLVGIRTFRPKIAVLLNIFDAHLDYHGTRKDYALAKANIFKHQTVNDYCVVNADDAEIMELSKMSKGLKVPFSVTKKLISGAYLDMETIYFQNERIIETGDIALPGKHNLENILAAVSVAKLLNVPTEVIKQLLMEFTGVKHRLQYIETIQERKFFNDSKATNILATQKALSAFTAPIILLAGGLDRGNMFDDLIPYLQNVKMLITFGQTAKKVEKAGREAGIQSIKHVDNVQEAVPIAFENSAEGDIILLSPACASWDQFKTFEERGDIFINAVHKLK
jgi:UDP-N-acetylmuramoylalanine--D-glutamate ligase